MSADHGLTYPGDVGVLVVAWHLGVQQLKLHLVHERSIVGVGENGLVVDSVIVHKLYVTHTSGPVNVSKSPFNSKKKTEISRLGVIPTGHYMAGELW